MPGPDTGGSRYVTSRRAAQLERELAELRGHVDAQLEHVRRELADARRLPLELLKAQTVAILGVYRETTTTSDEGGPTT